MDRGVHPLRGDVMKHLRFIQAIEDWSADMTALFDEWDATGVYPPRLRKELAVWNLFCDEVSRIVRGEPTDPSPGKYLRAAEATREREPGEEG